MGGKGGGGGSGQTIRPRGQESDRSAGPNRQQRRQQRPPRNTPQPQRMPERRQQATPARDAGLRIGAEFITRLYTPAAKPPPTAPGSVTNPELAIPQKDIDRLYGYGPTYAIPESDIRRLYGGSGEGGGSLLSEGEDFDSITGEVF